MDSLSRKLVSSWQAKYKDTLPWERPQLIAASAGALPGTAARRVTLLGRVAERVCGKDNRKNRQVKTVAGFTHTHTHTNESD